MASDRPVVPGKTGDPPGQRRIRCGRRAPAAVAGPRRGSLHVLGQHARGPLADAEDAHRVALGHQRGPVGDLELPQQGGDVVLDAAAAEVELGGQLHGGLAGGHALQDLGVDLAEQLLLAGDHGGALRLVRLQQHHHALHAPGAAGHRDAGELAAEQGVLVAEGDRVLGEPRVAALDV